MAINYEAYRKNKIESGLIYQDFVIDCCWTLLGLPIVQYASRLYQYNVGESRTGAEIKHDEKFSNTGNLWIEVREKARPRPGDYVPSGIQRSNNCWLYIIGDYDTIFIFPVALLRLLAASGKYRTLENHTKTSCGFLLPKDHAMKYAAQVLFPNAKQQVLKEIKDLEEIGKELHKAITANPNDIAQLDLWTKKAV